MNPLVPWVVMTAFGLAGLVIVLVFPESRAEG